MLVPMRSSGDFLAGRLAAILAGAGSRCNRDSVIPGWSEGPDLRCAIAHRGISRFRVRYAPRNDELNKKAPERASSNSHYRGKRQCASAQTFFLVKYISPANMIR